MAEVLSGCTAVNYTYDNDSRLTRVTDPTGAYQFTFDFAVKRERRAAESESAER